MVSDPLAKQARSSPRMASLLVGDGNRNVGMNAWSNQRMLIKSQTRLRYERTFPIRPPRFSKTLHSYVAEFSTETKT